MAELPFAVETPGAGVAVAADGNPHTVLQVVAPANQRLVLDSVDVGGKGTVVTDGPIRVRILRQTTAGTMTALTPVKLDDSLAETIQSTAQHTATAEPTASDVIWEGTFHPQSSTGKSWPYGKEPKIKGGGRLGMEITLPGSGSSNTVVGSMHLRE